jgi:hypothetical protein
MRGILRLVAMLVAVVLATSDSHAASCPAPLPSGGKFEPIQAGAGLVIYQNGFEVDIDGAPNAYHINGSNDANGGLEHICSGADINELKDGELVNRYPSFAVPGSSGRCLQDYITLRDAGFPACNTGLCARFYGVVSSNRGVPVRQADAQGHPLDFYISATSWHRHAAADTDQSAYLDARFVPYLVYDKSRLSPLGIRLGDIALVAWQGRATFAIFGDGGTHLNEASVATLDRLHGDPDSDRPNWRTLGVDRGATVIAFSNSSALIDGSFPMPRTVDATTTAAKQIAAAGFQALQRAGGSDAILVCAGLTGEGQIAKE